VRLRYLVAPVLSSLLLIGCASAPKLSSIKGALPPLSSDQARIYFYRAYRFGEAYQPEVTVNGEVVGKAQMEGVFFKDYPPATYKISTSMAQGKHLVLDLAAGETKYVRLTYRIGFNVYPELVDRATGVAESEGLSYTGVMFPAQGFTPAYVAEEPKDGPRALFKDPFIENLTGEWDITRTIRGKVVHNKASAAWVLNHQFLQLHMTDVSSPPAYEAIVLIGYDHEAQEYIAHWCDVFGGRFSGIGRGRLLNSSVAFTFTYPDGPFINTFTWNAKDRTWTSYMENVSSSGVRQFFAEDTYRHGR